MHLDSTSHPDGYVHYDVSWQDAFSEAPAGQGKIHELYGANAGIELALWRYLLDIDLVNTWRADERPLDDVAKFVVADSRAYAIKAVGDEQWLRILDVDVALGTRTYNSTDRAVTIMVRDPLIANNSGTWQSRRLRRVPQPQRARHRSSASRRSRRPTWVARRGGRSRRGLRERAATGQRRRRRQPVRQPPVAVLRQLLLTRQVVRGGHRAVRMTATRSWPSAIAQPVSS